MARFDLTDFEFELIRPPLPDKPPGVARVDDRRVLNGIFRVLRTGSPWRDLPERYGPYTTVYNRLNRWAKAGVRVRVFETLAEKLPVSMQFIDSSIIRAHQQAAAKKGGTDHTLGRSRGGLSAKINAMVDARGLPLAITLSPGQASDKAAVAALLAAHPPPGDIVADRGYDARAVLDLTAGHGGRGHIPTQRNRKVQRSVDLTHYKQRNLVQRFFNKLEHFRKTQHDTRKPPETTSLPSSSHVRVSGCDLTYQFAS